MNKRFSGDKILSVIFVLLVVVVTLFPLIYIFTASFKSPQEIMAGGAALLPKKWSVENYITAWKTANFALYTANSFIYAGVIMFFAVFFGSMLAYCFERYDYKIKKFVSACYYGSLFVSSTGTVFPIYMLLNDTGLNKTLLGLIIATIGMTHTYGVIMISSYLKSIPRELDESAVIDGCGPFRIYSQIIMPVIIPVLSLVAITAFKDAWNNYMLPMVLTLTKPHLRTLAVGVTALKTASPSGQSSLNSWNLLISGTVMAVVPIVIVYLICNRFFISGITSGSVKG